MADNNNNDVDLDNFEDIESMIDDEQSNDLFEEDDSGSEDDGFTTFGEDAEEEEGDLAEQPEPEDETEGWDEPDVSDGSEVDEFDEQGETRDEILDEEGEDDSDQAPDSKRLLLVGGMGAVVVGVAGFVVWDVLKSAGVVGQPDLPPPPPESTMSGWGAQDGANTMATTDMDSSVDFDNLMGEAESKPIPKPAVAVGEPAKPAKPASNVVKQEGNKLKLNLSDPAPVAVEPEVTVQATKSQPESPLSSIDVMGSDRTESAVRDLMGEADSEPAQEPTPQFTSSPIADPSTVSQEDVSDFTGSDLSYMRMERMMGDYAAEAGFVDDQKLQSKLAGVRSDLEQKISDVRQDMVKMQGDIEAQAKTDVEHDRRITALEGSLKAMAESGVATARVELPPVEGRSRLKGFKIISASDDGDMVTAKTPSGKVQVFFEGEVLHVRGKGSYTVQKIEGHGQRVLVGNSFYFDDVHLDAPKIKPKKAASKPPSQASKPSRETQRPAVKQSAKPVIDRSGRGRTVSGPSYVIAEKNPELIAQEVAEKGASVEYIAPAAKGWMMSGGSADRSSYLVKDPESNWHVVKVGQEIQGLGKVIGITESGNLAVGDFVIETK